VPPENIARLKVTVPPGNVAAKKVTAPLVTRCGYAPKGRSSVLCGAIPWGSVACSDGPRCRLFISAAWPVRLSGRIV
jgi:hypothetical protein